jgi:hypothetical protein
MVLSHASSTSPPRESTMPHAAAVATIQRPPAPDPVTAERPAPDPAAAELAALRARVDAGGPDAVRAAPALLERSIQARDLAADTARLLTLARQPCVRPELAGHIAARVAEAHATELVLDAVHGARPDPQQVEPIAAAAEFAYHRAPQRVQARTSVALARLLAGRAAEARNFLTGLNVAAAETRDRVTVLAVRALAELELGNVPQARRLVETAGRIDPAAGLLPLARLAVDRAEARAAA